MAGLNDFQEFVLIHVAFDFLLIAILGFFLTRHMPRLFALLVVVNLTPYFIHLPLSEIPGMKPQKGNDLPGYFELIDIVRRPENIIGQGNVPLPGPKLPELFRAFVPISSEIALDEPRAEALSVPREPFFFRWLQALRHDPYALWIFLRLFWLAGAVVLYFHQPKWGSALAGAQLIPFPFLTYAIPYGALLLISRPTYATLGEQIKDPSEIWPTLAPQFYTLLAGLGGTVLVLGAVIFMVAASRKLSPQKLAVRSFLKPDKYFVKLNGNLLPFEVQGEKIIIEGIPFDCSNVTIDSQKPNLWLLGTNTYLEFVERS